MVTSGVPWTFQQMFCLTPLCILLHSPPCNTCICISPHFSSECYPLSFGWTRSCLMVLAPLKCISMPCLLQMFLQLSLSPFMYGTAMYGLLLVLLYVVFLLFFLLSLVLILALFKAHTGYVQLLRALLRWSSSSFSRWWLEQTVLALCLRVLMTLYLADRWRWLSHCRYKSVYVGFV